MDKKYNLFVGRKDGTKEGGVYLYTFSDGELEEKGNAFPVNGFTHIDISDDRKLMAVTGMEGDKDTLYTLKIDGEKPELTDKAYINARKDICHADISHDRRSIVLTDFADSAIHLVRIDDEGKILSQKRIELEGSSTSSRQEKSHLHSCFFSNDDRFLLASDLGANRVFVTSNDDENKVVSSWYGRDGIGQRHVAFSKDGKTVYSLCEITGDIGVLELEENGELKEISLETYMEGFVPDYSAEPVGSVVLPENYLASADIIVSRDGKRLFVSYRKTKKISVHEIKDNTDISDYRMFLTEGMVRSLKLSDDGKYLFALGEELWRDIGRLEIFEVTEEGELLKVADRVASDAFIMAHCE